MNQQKKQYIKLFRLVAAIAAGFAVVMAFLLIINFVQTKLNDPIDNKTIPALVKRLSENPGDEALKAEIRAFDLMARKAFFTSQWQLRTGSYLMFLAIIISILSVRYILTAESKLNEIDSIPKINEPDQLKSRKWMIYVGSALILLAIVSGILSYNSLNDFTDNEQIAVQEEQAERKLEQEINTIALVDSAALLNDSLAIQPSLVQPSSDSIASTSVEIQQTSKGFPSLAEMKANYPFFRGAEGIGVAHHKNIPTDWSGTTGKNIIWKVKIPKQGYSSPIVWGNQLFVTGADAAARVVYCYDNKTGKLLWEASADGITGSPQKMPKVTADTGLAAPTMATDGQAVFAIFATGDIIALDLKGKCLWARNLGVPDNHYGHSSSLIIFKDKLLIQYDTNRSGKLLALSTQTGITIWETQRSSKISWSSPILVNTGSRTELILTTNPNVNSYDPQTGKELWNIECLSGEVGPSAGYASGMVFAANEYAKLVGIKLGETPEIVWESDEILPEVASPLAINGLLFLATSYGVLACFDANTGEKLWEQEFGDSFYASPIYADGKVYITDMQGKTHIIKADKEYISINTSELGEKVVCSTVFQNGLIYLRGLENLYCIGSK